MKKLTKSVNPWDRDVCAQALSIIEGVRALSDHYTLHHQLDSCQAWVYADAGRVYELADKFLMSYRTIVAYYSATTHILYVDGWYSRTTDKHISKFWREMGCPSIYRTYVPSSKIVVENVNPYFQIRKLSTGYYLYN